MNWQEILQTKRARTAIISFIIFVLAIITLSSILLISRSGKFEVSFYVEPLNAQVFLDGNNKNVNNSKLFLTPGNHTIQTFLNGYLYTESIFNINEYNLNYVNILIPTVATNEEINLIFGDINTISNEVDTDSNQQLAQKYPLITYLPYSTKVASYTISYNFNENFSSLEITIAPIKKDDYIAVNSARTILKDLANKANVTLPLYDIIFNDYTNAFIGRFQENTHNDPYKFLQTGYSNMSNIEIQKGQTSGDYYYTTIKQLIPIDGDYSDYVSYHAILKKSNNSWELISDPELLLTVYNTPDTPIEILDLANNYLNGD